MHTYIYIDRFRYYSIIHNTEKYKLQYLNIVNVPFGVTKLSSVMLEYLYKILLLSVLFLRHKYANLSHVDIMYCSSIELLFAIREKLFSIC